MGLGLTFKINIKMKTMTKAVLALSTASLLAISCTKFEEKGETLSTGKVFHASFETVGAPTTKTYLNSDHKLLWTEDDRLSIFTTTSNQQYRFKGNTGDKSGSFELVGDFVKGNSITANYAVYPYSESSEISNSEYLTVTLPSVQQYAAGSFGLGANTMVAVTNGTSDNFLAFKNLCGYLVIKLYGEGTVKEIKLSGNNGEKIAGTATVTASYGSEPSATMDYSATNEITLDCGSGVALGPTSQTATEFWFCIPPITFSKGFSIRVKSIAGGVMEKNISNSKAITRNTIYSMSSLKADFTGSAIPVPEMIDLGLRVKWAACNLGASSPEEYGYYYQWAGLEDVTSTSINVNRDICPYHTDASDVDWAGWTKYIPSAYSWWSQFWSGYDSQDNKTTLDPEDDIANVKLGGRWRMPTDAEWTELLNDCTWTWTQLNGINGYKVTSKIFGYIDKWIFLPASGYRLYRNLNSAGSIGYYWSSSVHNSTPGYAYDVELMSKGASKGENIRYYGLSVRPVSE